MQGTWSYQKPPMLRHRHEMSCMSCSSYCPVRAQTMPDVSDIFRKDSFNSTAKPPGVTQTLCQLSSRSFTPLDAMMYSSFWVLSPDPLNSQLPIFCSVPSSRRCRKPGLAVRKAGIFLVARSLHGLLYRGRQETSARKEGDTEKGYHCHR